jgi:prophage regulatory protein
MPDKFLRDAAVTEVTGVPKSTRYEMIKKGAFPRPIKLSERMVAWSAAEISDWMKRRIAARDRGRQRKPPPEYHDLAK